MNMKIKMIFTLFCNCPLLVNTDTFVHGIPSKQNGQNLN
jgi:hypothetical protein